MAGLETGAVQPAASDETADDRRLRHGYPPPELPPGSETTAYCGAPMTVEGTYTSGPPADACPLCVVIWQERNRR